MCLLGALTRDLFTTRLAHDQTAIGISPKFGQSGGQLGGVSRLEEQPCDPVFYDFGQGPDIGRHYRQSMPHSLSRDDAERLEPSTGYNEYSSLAVEMTKGSRVKPAGIGHAVVVRTRNPAAIAGQTDWEASEARRLKQYVDALFRNETPGVTDVAASTPPPSCGGWEWDHVGDHFHARWWQLAVLG